MEAELIVKLDAIFKKLIDFLKIESENNQILVPFLEYVIYGHNFFIEYKVKRRKDNGLLYIYSLGRNIARYATEFYWDNSAWEKVDYYTGKIYEYIKELNKVA